MFPAEKLKETLAWVKLVAGWSSLEIYMQIRIDLRVRFTSTFRTENFTRFLLKLIRTFLGVELSKMRKYGNTSHPNVHPSSMTHMTHWCFCLFMRNCQHVKDSRK